MSYCSNIIGKIMSLQDIRNARTEKQTSYIWEMYLKQRNEEGKKNKKQNNPLTKDKKKC